jgi:hypothetical protein
MKRIEQTFVLPDGCAVKISTHGVPSYPASGSDFNKKVAEAYGNVKTYVEGWQTKTPEGGTCDPGVDPQVKEQIRGDIDKLIEKNSK